MDTTKIHLVLSGSNVFIWTANEWLRLRQEFRIIGNCVGCITKKSRQINVSGLPMLLMPEEAKLLLDKGVGILTSQPLMKEVPQECIKKKFENYRNQLYEEQQKCLIDQRKIQISTVMDKIIEGKKRKILGLHTRKKKHKESLDEETKKALNSIDVDKDTLMQEEIAKLPKLDKNDALVQTHTAYPWPDSFVKIENWDYPNNERENLKYKVFKDIWERGYFVTSGENFGCDYIAYPGDPIMFHSQLMIECRDRTAEMSVSEFITECRMSCHVRKTLVYATLSKDGEEIDYVSSRWAGSSMGEL